MSSVEQSFLRIKVKLIGMDGAERVWLNVKNYSSYTMHVLVIMMFYLLMLVVYFINNNNNNNNYNNYKQQQQGHQQHCVLYKAFIGSVAFAFHLSSCFACFVYQFVGPTLRQFKPL